MNLDQQLQTLIEQAPTDLQKPIAHIAPLLKEIAAELAHQSYFIGQNSAQDWIVIVLQNNQQEQRRSIYAFSQPADVRGCHGSDAAPQELWIVDLLFQLLALESIDQLIFFDEPGNWQSGRTVSRATLQQGIEQQWQMENTLPPDIC